MKDDGVKVTEQLASLYLLINPAIASVKFKQKILCWQFSQTSNGKNRSSQSYRFPRRI